MTGTGDRIASPGWPPSVTEVLGPAAAGRAIARGWDGGSPHGANRWTDGRHAVHRFTGPGGTAIGAREQFSAWLKRLAAAAPFAVPGPVVEDDQWLVTEQPVGTGADQPEHHADPDDLVGAVGLGMRALHDLDIGSFPVDGAGLPDRRGWDAVAAWCRRSVEHGEVDADRLPEPYRRYRPDELLALFLDGRPEGDGREPVLCHGFPSAARFLIADGRFVGFDRMDGPVIGDRHLDLAIVHQSIQRHFGSEAVFRFYLSYGRDPDVVLLDHYVLATHLLGRAPIDPGAEPVAP